MDRAESLKNSDSKDGTHHILLVNTGDGSVTTSNDLHISKIKSADVQVESNLVVNNLQFSSTSSIVLGSDKLSDDRMPPLSLLAVDGETNSVRAIDPSLLSILPGNINENKPPSVTVKGLTIQSLTGNTVTNGNGNIFNNINIENSSMKASKIYLPVKAVDSTTFSADDEMIATINPTSGALAFSTSGIVINTKQGGLKVSTISPATDSSTAFVELNSAVLKGANTKIENAKSISTETMLVNQNITVGGPADFMGEVNMDKSLQVQGSVIGSGPYVDSSDIRFKKDILPFNNALGAISKLHTVCSNQ
jgi:hypothetical protein